jgi:tRNA threonylcarbamoyladenosine biosynthesis protein TsaE
LSSHSSEIRHFTIESLNVEQTIAIGFELGKSCSDGDVICINGELGAGKTHLVKGIGSAFGIPPDRISSPTYTLISEHQGVVLALNHMDAYRIQDESELGPIGFDDYIGRSASVMVIEWSNLISNSLPNDRLEIELISDDPANSPEHRRIEMQAHSSHSIKLLDTYIELSRETQQP